MSESVEESKALNDLHFPFIVISASGMCEAGRILHHLKNGIEDSRNLILITLQIRHKCMHNSFNATCLHTKIMDARR